MKCSKYTTLLRLLYTSKVLTPDAALYCSDSCYQMCIQELGFLISSKKMKISSFPGGIMNIFFSQGIS